MSKTIEKSLHFTIDGEWFTWFLRHLWIEGNEVKAVRTWSAAFPHLTSSKHLNTLFLQIVSGKKKFTGNSDGEGFGFEDDGSKYWSSIPGGKQDKSYPLVSSWEDVALIKRTKMYVAELRLRHFRLRRQYTERWQDYMHALRWRGAAEENEIENPMRADVNRYWTELRNIGRLVGLDMELPMLPTKTGKLNSKRLVQMIPRRSAGDDGAVTGHMVYSEIMSVLKPAEAYLRQKYGTDLLHIDYESIMNYCGLDRSDEVMVEEPATLADAAVLKSAAQALIPGFDLDTYMQNTIRASERGDAVEMERADKTAWNSGYISPTGNFYGCGDIQHNVFSVQLCKHLGMSVDKQDFDAQVELDKRGWVKISVRRFYWDGEHRLSDSQKQTMLDFMTGKGMTEAVFNDVFNKTLTIPEAEDKGYL